MVAEKLNVTYSEWSPLVEEDLNVERELNNNASIPLETKVVSKGGTLIGKTTLEVVKFSPERWLNSGSNSIPVYFFDEQGSLELVPSEQISDMVRGEWLITLKWWEGIGGLNLGIKVHNGDQLEKGLVTNWERYYSPQSSLNDIHKYKEVVTTASGIHLASITFQ